MVFRSTGSVRSGRPTSPEKEKKIEAVWEARWHFYPPPAPLAAKLIIRTSLGTQVVITIKSKAEIKVISLGEKLDQSCAKLGKVGAGLKEF